MTDLEILAEGLQQEGGALTLHYSSVRGWGASLVFGEEEEGSNMAGGAAYSLGPSIAICLSDLVNETGWRR